MQLSLLPHLASDSHTSVNFQAPNDSVTHQVLEEDGTLNSPAIVFFVSFIFIVNWVLLQVALSLHRTLFDSSFALA